LVHGTFIYRKSTDDGDQEREYEESSDEPACFVEGSGIAVSSGLVRDAPKRLARLDFCHPSQIPVGLGHAKQNSFSLAPYLVVLNDLALTRKQSRPF